MNAAEVVDYFIDTTMATIERMICRKKLPVNEFRRQCRIAQKGIDFLGPKYAFKSRASKLRPGQTVEDYYTREVNDV